MAQHGALPTAQLASLSAASAARVAELGRDQGATETASSTPRATRPSFETTNVTVTRRPPWRRSGESDREGDHLEPTIGVPIRIRGSVHQEDQIPWQALLANPCARNGGPVRVGLRLHSRINAIREVKLPAHRFARTQRRDPDRKSEAGQTPRGRAAMAGRDDRCRLGSTNHGPDAQR